MILPGICTRMFVKFSYFCQLLSSYEHFSAKHQVLGTHEARPGTLVEVSARSAHSGARGGRSKSFPAGVDKTISLVLVREATFCTYVSVNKCCLFSPLGSHEL